MNYFSRWIANLGVVPLFLFAAFLFFPALTFLAALLFLVTRVFETIYPLQLSTSAVQFSIRTKVLPSWSSAVKTFILISVSCLYSILSMSAQATEKTTIILSRGQHYEINFRGYSNYSITNKDTLSHKLKVKKRKILIKGRKLGFSEVILWKSSNTKKVLKIYVLHKNRHLKIVQLGETFEQMGLNIKLIGPVLKITGTVGDYPTYKKIKQLIAKNNEQIISKATLSRDLKSYILSEIYSDFLKRYIDSIDCQIRHLDIECNYSNHTNLKFEKTLKKKFFVEFNNLGIEARNSNLQVTFEIKKLSIISSENINPGLSKLQGKIQDLINNKLKDSLSTNQFNFDGLKGHLSTIAKPSMLLIPGAETKILLGSDVPFDQGEDKGTGFKFAGLKIRTKVEPKGKNFLCKFNIKLSKPTSKGSNSFEENEQSSQIIVTEGSLIQAFNIEIINDYSQKNMTPYISKFPLLGKLFQSYSDGNSIERILAYVRIERIK